MALQILIVDDSPAMRSFIRRVMRLSGLDVDRDFEAENGVEGLSILHANHVDAVLTDINMPVMDGEEFVRRMRNQPTPGQEAKSPTPVIVVSTDGTASRIQTMLSLGASGYLQKPFGPEQLRNEVERVLGTAHER